MRRGQGSLIVLTRNGALEAGYPASRAPRTVTPTTWARERMRMGQRMA
jgi:hypothetical protein